jgi:hypothetical protein
MARALRLGIIVAMAGAVAHSASAYSTDFESFASGTPLSSLSVTGMTFTAPAGNDWQIYPGYVDVNITGNALGSFGGYALTLTFDTPQTHVAFGYRTVSAATVQAYRGTTVVGTFNTPGNGDDRVTFADANGITSVVFPGVESVVDNINTDAIQPIPTLGGAGLAALAALIAAAGVACLLRRGFSA